VIALDTSAIVAIALGEAEAEGFIRQIAVREALVGAPSLLESRMVLTSRMHDPAVFLDDFLEPAEIHIVDFSFAMYQVATTAFDRFGKGRGHPARLNFGDCLAYAVAKLNKLPLLYKGHDFSHTDIDRAVS
jgi:ribonuclease VapC